LIQLPVPDASSCAFAGDALESSVDHYRARGSFLPMTGKNIPKAEMFLLLILE